MGKFEQARTGIDLFEVFTFYDKYLYNFYAQRPDLVHAPYDVQLRELYLDCFGIAHMYAEHLRSTGARAQWTVANCYPLQARWALEHGVTFGEHTWQGDILRSQVEAYRPTIFYSMDPVTFDSRFVRTLSNRPDLVVGWRAAPSPPETDWSDFDLILSHLDICQTLARKHGARDSAYFRPSVPEMLRSVAAHVAPQYDVVFSGQWTPCHHTRNQILLAIAEGASRNLYSLGLYLSAGDALIPPALNDYLLPAQWGRKMFGALKSGRIVVNAEIDLAKGNAGNLRLFETTAVGGFLLTEHQPNIEEYFTPGVHLDTYKSIPELLDKIRYYLSHEEERQKIAHAGQEHVHRVFGMDGGSALLMKTISEHIMRAQMAAVNGVP